MLPFTPERLSSWITYAVYMLNSFTTLTKLTEGIEILQTDMAMLKDQWDIPQLKEEMSQLHEALLRAQKRLEMLQRVKVFTGEENPHSCSHTHKRRYTGVFFNSVEVILCLTCQGWQREREVIR